MLRLSLAARNVTFAILALSAIAFLFYSALVVSFPYTIDYGEGVVLDRAMAIVDGHPIYRRDLADPPYIVTNYTPLYILCLVPIVKLGGPSVGLVGGRLLSLACSVLSALMLGLIVKDHTGDRIAAWGSALTFLAMPFTVQWSALLRVDMLALMLSVAGLYVVSRWHQSVWAIICTGLLFTAAVFTRQSSGLAAPLAAFVWIWHRSGIRRALVLATATGTFGLGALMLADALTNGGFTYHVIVANVNEFRWDTVWAVTARLACEVPILLLLAVAWIPLARAKAPMAPLVLPYLLGACLAAGTIGKVGSNVNYLLELCAALGLAASIGYARDSPLARTVSHIRVNCGLRRISAGTLLPVAMVMQTAVLFGLCAQFSATHLRWRSDLVEELTKLNRIVAESPDPVLADQHMGLLTLQGRSLYLQPFGPNQLALAGRWDQQPFLEAISEGRFSLILIEASVHRETRWTNEMLNAIEATYVETGRLAGSVLYRPRTR